MSVPYDQAVKTIQSVVGEQVDREVIALVLESNQGHMERTIEQLLQMSGQIPDSEVVSTNPASTNRPAPANDNTEINQDQVLDDELYARMLQDELFMQEMQTDPDFERVFGSQTRRTQQSSSRTSSPGGGVAVARPQQTDLIDDLKRFGDATKLKMKEMWMKLKKTNNTNSNTNNQNTAAAKAKKTDEAEVITLDNSLVNRRVVNHTDDDNDDDEVPLRDKTRAKNSKGYFQLGGSEEGAGLLGGTSTSNARHTKSD